jgi:hypothetical protein
VDPAYISAFAALAGASIGGTASFGTAWLTQRAQLRHARREAEHARLVALYSDFIAEASRLLADALSHQKDDVADMVNLYALIGRMRLVSPIRVVTSAEAVAHLLIETYLAPNRSLHELVTFAKEGSMDLLVEFGEACREDLIGRNGRW